MVDLGHLHEAVVCDPQNASQRRAAFSSDAPYSPSDPAENAAEEDPRRRFVF
jgi:hypothetical protein